MEADTVRGHLIHYDSVRFMVQGVVCMLLFIKSLKIWTDTFVLEHYFSLEVEVEHNAKEQ